MKNVETKIEKNILRITVDLSKDFGPSKSGKTVLIATTEGNVQVQPGVYLGLNIYRKEK